MWGRLGPRAGIPKRLRPKLPTNVLNCSIRKEAGTQRPHCAKGRDPRIPASWRHLPLRVVAATSVAADPSDTTLRRRTIFSDTIRVDVTLLGPIIGIFIFSSSLPFPPRLFLCSLSFTFSSAVVFQFQIASFDTPCVRENAAQFLFWVSLVSWRSPLTNGWQRNTNPRFCWPIPFRFWTRSESSFRHFSAEDLCDVHGLVSARHARAASGQKSCDRCPCPLRLQSSLLVLGCTGLMRSTRFRQLPILLRRSPDSVHRQSAELPCCASVTSYLQCYRSEDRRDPTAAVVCQIDDFRCYSTTGAWS